MIKLKALKLIFYKAVITSMNLSNIFSSIPANLEKEIFEDILTLPNLRVERIISRGQSSPDVGWYDQLEHEWVLVLEGNAILEFETGPIALGKGDYLNIPAHTKHKVKWTDPTQTTIWLAIFYKD